MKFFSFLCCQLLASLLVSARPEFQSKIPNGANIKDDQGNPAPGVGHIQNSGGGNRNEFGLHFQAAGYEWTQDLCQKDSDGDKLTNGQELGDPNCVWKEGETPTFDKGLTHPGIKTGDRTAPSVDTCKDYTALTGVKQKTMVFPAYTIPNEHTTYAKSVLKWDISASARMVRIDVVNKNPSEVHHMILYQCATAPSQPIGSVATDGNMNCFDISFAWAVGGKDFCFPPNVGIDMGKFYVLEIHYDNPQKKSGLSDTSGFKIHYIEQSNAKYSSLTPAGTLLVGASLDFTIPAKMPYYQLKATQQIRLDSTHKIFASMVHGHKQAKKIWTTHARLGSDLACNTEYDFDLQEFEPKQDHIEIKNGDTITTKCVYNTGSLSTVVNGGDASDEEMCIVVFMYYPKSSKQSIQLVDSVQGTQETKKCELPGVTNPPTATPKFTLCTDADLLRGLKANPDAKADCMAYFKGKTDKKCPCWTKISSGSTAPLKCKRKASDQETLYDEWTSCQPGASSGNVASPALLMLAWIPCVSFFIF